MKEINAIIAIAFRDVTKLLRDRTRIAANFIFPTIFIGVLGGSLQSNLSGSLPYNFLTFVFTGVLAQTLFQSTANGLISLIEDRQNDFAQELFIAPVSRYSIIFGKIIGETLVSFFQVSAVIIFGFIIGVPISILALIKVLPVFVMIAIFGGSFGVFVMSNLSEQRSANQIFPFLMFPQFFLAGVFNPIKILPAPLLFASRLAPMTYAVDMVRTVYYSGTSELSHVTLFSKIVDFGVIATLSALFIIIGTYRFVQNEKNR